MKLSSPSDGQESRGRSTAGRLEILNVARGLAALLVCLSHARAFIFVQAGEAPPMNVFWSAFYFITSLGYQAVIVFFVLSGFTITWSIAGKYSRGDVWIPYAVDRLSRLWIVLVPALIWTLLCDKLGLLIHPIFYSGADFNRFSSGPDANVAIDLSLSAFLTNFTFLQTTKFGPVYGSNGPLWSLHYEFVYYAVFPFLFESMMRFGWLKSLAFLLAGAAVFSLASGTVLSLWGTWVLGMVLALALRRNPGASIGSALLYSSIPAFLTALLICRLSQGSEFQILGSYLLAGSTVALLYSFHQNRNVLGLERVFDALSRISYSLYLTHFPILALLFGGGSGAFSKLPPSLYSLLLFVAGVLVSILVAAAFYWAFEQRTHKLRCYLNAALRSFSPLGRART